LTVSDFLDGNQASTSTLEPRNQPSTSKQIAGESTKAKVLKTKAAKKSSEQVDSTKAKSTKKKKTGSAKPAKAKSSKTNSAASSKSIKGKEKEKTPTPTEVGESAAPSTTDGTPDPSGEDPPRGTKRSAPDDVEDGRSIDAPKSKAARKAPKPRPLQPTATTGDNFITTTNGRPAGEEALSTIIEESSSTTRGEQESRSEQKSLELDRRQRSREHRESLPATPERTTKELTPGIELYTPGAASGRGDLLAAQPAFPDNLLQSPPPGFNLQGASADFDMQMGGHLGMNTYLDASHNGSIPQHQIGHVNVPSGNQPGAQITLNLSGLNVLTDMNGRVVFVDVPGFGYMNMEEYAEFAKLGSKG
jgi:hypothetical protein